MDSNWREIIDTNYPHLRELRKLPITVKIEEGPNGWMIAAYNGDGSQPGSLIYGSGGHNSIYSAVTSLPSDFMTKRARTEYETPDETKYVKED